MDTSFDEYGNLGERPGYGTNIENGCREVRKCLIEWKDYLEEIDYTRKIDMAPHRLRGQITFHNRMHREQCGVQDLMHVIDALDLCRGLVSYSNSPFWVIFVMMLSMSW